MPRYKLGKLAPKPNLKTIPFHKFLATDAPPPPPEKVYWEYKLPVNNLRMLGNDTVGDCTCACVGHMIMNMTAHTGSILIPTDEEILAFYSAITGYDPSQTDSQGNNPTDTGAAITDVLARWQSDGITIGGQVHKILGWMQFDHTNREQMAQVIYLFGAADCGVVLPNSAMDQFNAGQDWDVVADDGGEDGGHCIPAFGQGGAGVTFITWAKLQAARNAWPTKYLDEAYGVIAPDWFDTTDVAPNHFDKDALWAYLKELAK